MASSFAALHAPKPVARWLAEKTAAERLVVLMLLVIVVLAFSWAAIWQPLVRDAAATRAARDNDAGALATARRMSEEIAGLARGEPLQTPRPEARAALERILTQQDLRSAVTQFDWQDGRARLVFAAVGFEALMIALEALHRDAGLRAVAVSLTARVEPGMVRAELTLAR